LHFLFALAAGTEGLRATDIAILSPEHSDSGGAIEARTEGAGATAMLTPSSKRAHPTPSGTIDEGRHIDRSDGQSSNARYPRLESRESGSNVTVERVSQPEKQRSPIVSTDEGMSIQ
jgi:hypothetical protein